MTEEKSQHKVVIVPCSGIGKTYGTVSREAAYALTEDVRPEETQLVALSLLVLGDEAARAAVSANPAVTRNGMARRLGYPCRRMENLRLLHDSAGRPRRNESRRLS